MVRKEKKYRKDQNTLAREESQAMRDFEKRLVLARIEVWAGVFVCFGLSHGIEEILRVGLRVVLW